MCVTASTHEESAVLRGQAQLPCDITTNVTGDSVFLVVWYKDNTRPIYRRQQWHTPPPRIACLPLPSGSRWSRQSGSSSLVVQPDP
ncbi:Toxin TxpA [Frankliniella fusca]|uniref:Toxin TxpA n=1 Tax=Frankliniella fusca TaxID=407009 RepID=A0AAE1LQU0_9NEOP|nr:Toxin TxpA [Frankliniella fusca]